jgi:2'-5' RNA ligase
MTELIRSFIAVKIEAPETVARISILQQDLQKSGLHAKFVETENFHLTLRFLGEVPLTTLETVKNRLSEVKFHPFRISLKGVGAFPAMSRPRVLWIGVEEGAEDLVSLANQVRGKLASIKLPEPDEDFHPHLTIARLKGPLNAEARKIIESSKDLLFGAQEIKYFALYQSILTPRGPIYKELMRYELS